MNNKAIGRPIELTDQQADELLQRIDGDSLLDIVQSDGDWPSYRTILTFPRAG